MDKKDKRKKILKISGLIGLFLLVFGLSYALFTVTLNGTKKVKLKTGKLELQLLDDNNQDITDANNAGYVINLDNQVPVDDETGLGTQAFEFKLKNNGTIDASYTIYLDDVALESGETRLPDSAVRYSLTKNGSADSAQDLTSIGSNPNRKLDEGVIKKDATNTYTLKIWIAEDAGNEAMDKVFNATLRVEGTQYIAPAASEYGVEIASAQLSETITATYYQPEETGYNTSSVKRMSNVKKIDNEETYEGGTLVISGEGEIQNDAVESLYLFLGNVSNLDDLQFYEEDYYEPILKYSPQCVVFEEGITKIGEYMFSHINSITKIDLPNTLIEIGDNSFEHTSISNIELPDSLQVIGSSAFEDCENIEKVIIPSSVVTVRTAAFYNCSHLREILISSSTIQFLKTSSSGTFDYISNDAVFYCLDQATANNLNYGDDNQNTFYGKTIVVDPSRFE